MEHFETVWSFATARFTVALEIMPEDMDPADSFQFEEDIDAIRNGDVEWFQARVSVYLDGQCVAWDCLGGCAYKTVREFYTAHRDADPANRNCAATNAKHRICHYFPGMVKEAIAEARKHLCDAPRVRCTS